MAARRNRGSNTSSQLSSGSTAWLFLILSSLPLSICLLLAFGSLMIGSWLLAFFGPVSAFWIAGLIWAFNIDK